MPRSIGPALLAALSVLASGAARADQVSASDPGFATKRPDAAEAPEARTASAPTTPLLTEGLVVFDYTQIPIRGYKPIDLLGFNFYKKYSDWFYAGFGGYAPLVKGDYGGTMAFDVSLQAQQKLYGKVFGNIGASIGAGGGGNSVEQSKVVFGSGGFQRVYAGLGYDFDAFSAGLAISRLRFTNSPIDHTQFNLFAQVPFGYYSGPYARAGALISVPSKSERASDSITLAENSVEIGVDSIKQIHPAGSFTGNIGLINVGFSQFISSDAYVLFLAGIGYHGLPTYNQAFGGLGYRYNISDRLSLRGQLALGSGGYAAENINTGAGLLVHPRVSAEYLLTKDIGILLSTGYLYAPSGTSKNTTWGASLNFHNAPRDLGRLADQQDSGATFKGYRLHILGQAELNAYVDQTQRGTLKLLSLQVDNVVSKNIYIPLQLSGAYGRYLGYPGYAELLIGLGLQTAYNPNIPVQWFAQLLGGTNVHGALAKPSVGFNYSVNDQLALYAMAGGTYSLNNASLKSNYQFKSPTFGLGLTYRFSMPRL